MPFSVACPECGSSLEVEDEHRGWLMRCPQCRHEFRASGGIEPASTLRPRRRRRDRDHSADALHDVFAPSVCLELLGWLGLFATLSALGLFIAAGVNAANNPGIKNREDAVVLFLLGGCTGMLGLPYHAILIYGARKFRRLSSRTWAMTAAVLASSMFAVVNVFGIFHVVPGVWALIVLDKRHVKAAFEHYQEHGGEVESFDDPDDR